MGDKWIGDLEAALEKINPSAELESQRIRCIYRVPKILRELNNEAYTPQLISFGPYHHDLDHLKPMEPHKRRALFHYLSRAAKTLAEVVEAMRPEAPDLMDSYDGLEEPWTDEGRFLELMILDGCFLLDIMIWHAVDFWRPYMTIRLWMDMLMLENQLPLSVLAILIDVGGHKIEDSRNFVKYYLDSSDMQQENIRRLGHHHLDIYRKNVTKEGEYMYDPNWNVRPATELFQAGIGFERSETNSLKDISFSNGILRLPFFKVDDNTVPLLLNFLAFEQVRNEGNAVTSYAFLMNNLVNSTKDVVLLREKGIIKGWVGNDDDIATHFNSLTKAITFAEWTGRENVNKKLNEYCGRMWHKWRAIFIQSYLSNPWVFISFLGATILLLLTIVQAVYTILPYYK